MIIHTVERGDSLYSLARRYNTTPARIASDNALSSPASLTVGQALVILEPTQTYTVGAGDTLYSIAMQYGVSINQLLRNNPQLLGEMRINEGDNLIISLPAPEFDRTVSVTGYAYPFINRQILTSTLPYLTYLSIFTYGINEAKNSMIIDSQSTEFVIFSILCH